MADILTPAELDAIRERCEAMPPRPRCRCSSFAIQYEGGCMCEAGQWDRAASDRAVLILAGVPRLLAHVAALEAALPADWLLEEAAEIANAHAQCSPNPPSRGRLVCASNLRAAAARIRALTPQPTQEPQP